MLGEILPNISKKHKIKIISEQKEILLQYTVKPEQFDFDVLQFIEFLQKPT